MELVIPLFSTKICILKVSQGLDVAERPNLELRNRNSDRDGRYYHRNTGKSCYSYHAKY